MYSMQGMIPQPGVLSCLMGMCRYKSLFFDCVMLKCGDLFCRNCAASMQDCILCGADVEQPKTDPRVNCTLP